MDDKTTKKTTISDLAAEAAKTKKAAEQNQKAKKTSLPIIIAIIVIVLGVGIALYFILRNPAEQQTGTEAEGEEEVVYAAPEDSTDPGADFINHHQATIESADATDQEKLDAQLSIANLYSVTEKYDEAEETLNAISRDKLTKRQLFNLYSAYAYLYQEDHKNDVNAYNEYSALVEEVLNEYWDEEDGVAPEADDATPSEE